MNYKTTIALILLLAIVGGYFYFVESDRPAASRPDAPGMTIDTARPLFAADELSTESIDRVTVERGQERYVFAKQDADWLQIEPVRFKLSPWAWRTLVDRAASLKLYDTLKGETLDDPFAVVTLEDTAAGKTFTLRLGATTIGGRAKATLDDGEDVLLVGDALHNAVRDMKVNDLRDKVLAAPGASRVGTFTIRREGGELTLIKADNGRWYLDAAHTERADASEVEKIISAFGRLGIDRFVADAPPRLDGYGLDEPRMTLTLTTPDRTVPDTGTIEPGETIVLKVGRPADLDGNSFFALRSPSAGPLQQAGSPPASDAVVFTVKKDVLAPFEKSPAVLRDSRLFTAALADVRALSVEQGREVLKVERDDAGKFRFVEPAPDFDADYSETTALIERALGLEASEFEVDFQPTGDPAARVSINSESAAFYHAGDAYWAVRDGESVAYSIAADDLAPLLDADVGGLRNRTVLDLKRDSVDAVTLTRSDRATMRFTRDDPGDWMLEGHDAFEREDFEQLLSLLTPLRAERWAGTDAQTGSIVAEAKIETRDGAARTLTVGSEHAFVEGIDEPFVISDALRSRLNAEYRLRTVIDLMPQDIASVARTQDGATRTVKLENNVYTWDAEESLSGSAAAALFDTLAGLRVERFATQQTFATEDPAAVLLVTPHEGPTLTLTLTSDGRTATLAPAPGSDEPYRDWFTLDEQTWKKLTASLSVSAQPLPEVDELMEGK